MESFYTNIINNEYNKVPKEILIKEIERLELKKERLRTLINEDYERVVLKIDNINKYLNYNI